MFGKKEKTKKLQYDAARQRPVIKCSICTGEQVAGFQDVVTGKFEEVMLIQSGADLRQFKELYGLDEVAKIY